MSKIICEICGTVYPDNATQCPICGYPVKGEETPQLGQVEAAVPVLLEEVPSVEPVKGGRFSNSNVKKRNQTQQPVSDEKPAKDTQEEPAESDKPVSSDRGLKIAVIVLLIAVILVASYIGFRFFAGAGAYEEAANRTPAGQTSEDEGLADESSDPVDTGVACTNLVLSDSNVTLSGQGRGWLLSVTAVPADTTDTITYASSDESVAVVTADGRITAVAPGTCVITISCGSITKECKVYCNFEVENVDDDDSDENTNESGDTTDDSTHETEKPTDNTTASTTEKEGFNLSHTDVTFSFKGDHFTFTAGKGISNAQVTWSIDKPEVAAISSNGKVVAVGPGTAEITATYEGETQKCIIRCTFEDDGSGSTSAPTDGTVSTDTSWEISHEDVTISVGESFQLTITNDSGETATVTWSAGNSGLVTTSGNTVTGKASGNTTVTCNFNGQTYSCIVRVK